MVQTSLETLLYLSPSTEVHILVLTGQNDAIKAVNKSRKSNSAPKDTRVAFYELVNSFFNQMEKDMACYPQVRVHFAIPFDSPEMKSDQLYTTLVDDLRGIIRAKERKHEFGGFLSFVDDYHLAKDDREKFARQVLGWLDTA